MPRTFKDLLRDFREVREARYRTEPERELAINEAVADLFDEALAMLASNPYLIKNPPCVSIAPASNKTASINKIPTADTNRSAKRGGCGDGRE